MDAQVNDAFLQHEENARETRALGFLLDEGLDFLANYSRISDIGVRTALAGLIDALARAEPLSSKEAG